MKQLIWIIFLFLCAIGLAMLAKTYTGNVYFVVEGYSLRMNLNFFIIAALLSVFVWYLLIKLLVSIFGTPHRLSQFGASRRSRKAAQELNAAGLAYFEGKFQEAAQHADKVLANKQAGDNRMLALMLAAHAADQSHNTEARDQYLNDIAQLPGKAQLSRHLLLAESALNQQDYDTANTHLTAAAQINPRLTRLARLQLRMALDKGDALDILDKTEKLHRAGAMNETEAQQTAEVAYRKLLDLATDAAGMKACLKRIPETLRNNALNVAIARKYNELGLYDQAIAWVNTHYPATRDANLLPPFVASVRYLDDRRQQKAIDTGDAWLKDNPKDARLLMYLGELAAQKQLWGKAQGYLEASLQAQATPQARLVLAKVFDEMDKPGQAEQQRQLVLSEITPEDDETAAE